MSTTKHKPVFYALMTVLILALSGLGFYAVRQLIRGNVPALKNEPEGNT